MEENENSLIDPKIKKKVRSHHHMKKYDKNPLFLIFLVLFMTGIAWLLGSGVAWFIQFVSDKAITPIEGLKILKTYYLEFVLLFGFPLLIIYLWWNRKDFTRPFVKSLYYLRLGLTHGGWLFLTIFIVLALAIAGAIKWEFLPDSLADSLMTDSPMTDLLSQVFLAIMVGGVVLLVLINNILWLVMKITGVGSETIAHNFLYQDVDSLYKPIEYIKDKTLLKFYKEFPYANQYYWDDITIEMEAATDFEGWTEENLTVRHFAAQKRGQHIEQFYKAVSM